MSLSTTTRGKVEQENNTRDNRQLNRHTHIRQRSLETVQFDRDPTWTKSDRSRSRQERKKISSLAFPTWEIPRIFQWKQAYKAAINQTNGSDYKNKRKSTVSTTDSQRFSREGRTLSTEEETGLDATRIDSFVNDSNSCSNKRMLDMNTNNQKNLFFPSRLVEMVDDDGRLEPNGARAEEKETESTPNKARP